MQMRNLHLEQLRNIQGQPDSLLEFISEAWLQVKFPATIFWEVLKISYEINFVCRLWNVGVLYGYFLPEREHAKTQNFEGLKGLMKSLAGLLRSCASRIFLIGPSYRRMGPKRDKDKTNVNYQQKRLAEVHLQQLQQCAEQELRVYLYSEGPSTDFNEFRTKLAGLTCLTRKYFEDLNRAVENGLSDVIHGATSGSGTTSSSESASSSQTFDDSSHWSCEHCTFTNVMSTRTCQMS